MSAGATHPAAETSGSAIEADAIQAAVAVEREACAVAAWMAGMSEHDKALGFRLYARHVGSAAAKAIRARSSGTADAVQQRIKDLEDALQKATTSVRDLANGWPVRELHEAPSETMARLDRLVPSHEVLPFDPNDDESEPRADTVGREVPR